MSPEQIDQVLQELAATSTYVRESGRLMREAVEHLVEGEERIIKTNHYMSLIIERIERAISAALRAKDGDTPPAA